MALPIPDVDDAAWSKMDPDVRCSLLNERAEFYYAPLTAPLCARLSLAQARVFLGLDKNGSREAAFHALVMVEVGAR